MVRGQDVPQVFGGHTGPAGLVRGDHGGRLVRVTNNGRGAPEHLGVVEIGLESGGPSSKELRLGTHVVPMSTATLADAAGADGRRSAGRGEHDPVDDRRRRPRAATGDRLRGAAPFARRDNASSGSCSEHGHAVGVGGRAANSARKSRATPVATSDGASVMGGAALRDRLVEQALARGQPEQRADAHAAGRLAEDRDVGRGRRRTPRCCRAPTRARRPGRGCRRCPSRRTRRRRARRGAGSRTRRAGS